MNIALLTRDPGLYSSQSLYKACLRKEIHPQIIDYSRCSLIINQNGAEIYYRDKPLIMPDGIIPRIGAHLTKEGAALIRHLEGIGIPTVMASEALVKARDKMHCLQLLSRSGVSVPTSVLAEPYADLEMIVGQVGGYPCVVKPLSSTHGLGVTLVMDRNALLATIYEEFRKGSPVMIQEYIAESAGSDVRAFVVDGKVVGAMKRVAKEGDFRSNLHQGGTAYKVKLTGLGEEIAILAAKTVGLGVAGVDILESDRGPLVLEVNASPGLEGIEKVTLYDIAGEIVDYLVRCIKNHH